MSERLPQAGTKVRSLLFTEKYEALGSDWDKGRIEFDLKVNLLNDKIFQLFVVNIVRIS